MHLCALALCLIFLPGGRLMAAPPGAWEHLDQAQASLDRFRESRSETDLRATLRHLDRVGPEVEKSDWPARRHKKIQLLLETINEMDAAFDPTFDPNKLVNDPPAVISKLPFYISGMSPEAIADPELRKQFKKELAENQKKRDAHLLQFALREERREAIRFCSKLFGGSVPAAGSCRSKGVNRPYRA